MTGEKAAALKIAADLTVAASAGLATVNRTVDPSLQDPVQRAINLEVWEIFRAYYAAVVGACNDDTDWAPPTKAAATASPAANTPILNALRDVLQLPAVAGALNNTSALSPLLTALQSLVGATTPATAAPLPSPGQAVSAGS